MSLEHTDRETWSRPLLPAALEARLVGWALRLLGLALAAGAMAGWIVLLTWQSAMPGRAAGSLFGAIGGLAGEVMLNAFGVVCIACLVLPLLWGAELALSEKLAHGRSKTLLLPLAVLLLAGGAAALPAPSAWPLAQGLGGLVGSVVLALTSAMTATVIPRYGVVVAGGIMLAAGAGLLTHVALLSIRDLLRDPLDAGRPRHGRRAARDVDFARLPVGSQVAGVGITEQLGKPHSGRLADVPEPRAASRFGPYVPHEISDEMRAPAAAIRPTPAFDASHFDEDPPQPHWRDALADLPPLDATADDVGDDPGELEAGRDLARRLVRVPPDQRRSAGPVGAGVTAAVSTLGHAIARGRRIPAYKRPNISALRRSAAPRLGDELSQTVLRGTARLLLDVLESFGVRGQIRAMRTGPVVTLFEFEPAAGVKTARVTGLADDIARAMNSASARIAASAGRSMITIELPNPRREQITVRDIIETDMFRRPGLVLPLAIGKTVTGEPVVLDLSHLPHILVAGSVAARPPIALHAMLLSLVYRHGPETCRLLLIDPRLTDLSAHMGLPHLAMPVVSDPVRGAAALSWAVGQMEERAKQMATIGARSLDVFNNRVRNAKKLGERAGRTVQTGFEATTGRAVFERETLDAEPLAHLVVVISELAELMAVDGPAVEQALVRLARGGPAVGIHIIAATDHPKEDILTGAIRQALTARLCLKVPSKLDSRTVLGEAGAEQLLSDGDMLVHDGVSGIVRMHAAVASIEDVEAVAAALQATSGLEFADDYPDVIAYADAGGFGPLGPAARGSADELYESAVALVVRSRSPSAAMLQQRLRIDAHHARALVERMHREGLVFDEE